MYLYSKGAQSPILIIKAPTFGPVFDARQNGSDKAPRLMAPVRIRLRVPVQVVPLTILSRLHLGVSENRAP